MRVGQAFGSVDSLGGWLVLRLALLAACIGGAALLGGCQRQDGLLEIKEHFAAMESHIDAQYEKLKSDCEGMLDSEACREAAWRWYMDSMTEFCAAYLKALEDHWAERRRRAR